MSEETILAKLNELEVRLNGGFLKRNWFPILSFVGTLVVMGIWLGRLESQVTTLQAQRTEQAQQFHQSLLLINSDLTRVESEIKTHHEDTDRHVDSAWKAQVMQQLDSIRNLLVQHLSDSRRSSRAL